MKTIAALVFLFFTPFSHAEELLSVENSTNNKCHKFGCMYKEWSFKSDSTIRFVSSGFEDGSDNTFFEILDNGKYSIILDVIPIIQDGSGKHWWGYAWDIKDIPISIKNGDLYIRATFDHTQELDGNHSPPEWQKCFPVVLFNGEKTRWNIEQPKYDFHKIKLRMLAERARQLTSQEKTPSTRTSRKCGARF